MFVKKFEECEHFSLFGNDYRMLIPRDITDNFESSLVRLKKGSITPPHTHPDEDQIYIILSGEGEISLNGKLFKVMPHSIVWIPRNTEHTIKCTSNDSLEYVFVAVWPKGIPLKAKNWKKAYKIGQK